MKKYIILLIPLILFSSCSTDRSNEKDIQTGVNKNINPYDSISCKNAIHTTADYSPIHEQSGSLYFFDGSGAFASSFKKYDCINHVESELLSARAFEEISNNLPIKYKDRYRIGLYGDIEGSAFSISKNILTFGYFPPCAEQCGDSDTMPYYFITINLDTKNVLIERERPFIKEFTIKNN